MKKIKIERIVISHFKGIRALEIPFGNITNVYGDNATGKTTIMDAFLWTLFGKDSTDRKDFEIKHISMNGSGMKDAEVEIQITIDDVSVSLKRCYREKWQKKRGNEEAEFVGHETVYTYNDVPVTMKEYQEKVSDICEESVFKLITNPLYFPGLKWQDQRTVLFDIAEGNDETLLNIDQHPDFKRLLASIDKGKTLDEYRRQIGAQKKRIREQLDFIPARIDEVNRSIPAEEDWKDLKTQIKSLTEQLAEIDAAIADKSKAYEKAYDERAKIQGELFKAKETLAEIVNKHKEQAKAKEREANRALIDKAAELDAAKERAKKGYCVIEETKQAIKVIEDELITLRNQFNEVNSRQFEHNPDDCVCPTCRRPLDDFQEREDEMRKRFNTQKTKELTAINEKGVAKKALVQEYQKKVISYERGVTDLEIQILKLEQETTDLLVVKVDVPEDLSLIPGYLEAKNLVDALAEKYSEPIVAPDVAEQKMGRAVVAGRIDELNATLSLKDRIDEAQARIKELEKQQKTMAQELADLERQEFTIAAYEKARADAIEQKVNGMFSLVKWQLFERQINGQEIPACVATYRGVPYSDLNSAAKINVGIDIINTLSRHYQISAPIFIDNAEGVNALEKPVGQLIRLVVSEHEKLFITND
jgi:exonuclease SbcC